MPHGRQDAGPVETCVTYFAALASPDRLKIVRLLTAGPCCVTEIAQVLSIPPVNLSHHLTVLREAELVVNERRGRMIFYSLRPGVLPAERSPVATQETLDLGCCKLVIPLTTGTETSA
ncbi:ArsR/SmtB family transcription factor [Limnoglobus roseus]|uniref:ArsR family transcriptional regulator n=1 Tax=Limnoglobus roseus TaxID=2598579 RepID=A0A5C1AIE4_9BACT|nr:metalloregulator ArsR/SmtB family transcription factor [Limnoglobus roseus]QEL19199.1 ArsR family transcriptional regulator [Limnoglobus roseus]